jgi:cytochrome c biogenesis protein CcmG, thiol:disulfide interchange protein DsbE
VHFVGVLYNDQIGNAVRWLRDRGPLPYPSVNDPKARTAIDYGLYGVPETFFIGRDGRVAYKHIGPLNDSVLEAHIGELRAKPAARGP